MDITFNCGNCGEQLTIDESGAGTTVECPVCTKPINVPSQSSFTEDTQGKPTLGLKRQPSSSDRPLRTRPKHAPEVVAPPIQPPPIPPIITWTEELLFSKPNLARIGLGLRSGSELRISEVMLYPQALITEAKTLMDSAEELMSGFSTGIGFWGSPKWVLSGALLLGAAESLVSSGMAETGKQVIAEAVEILEKIREHGRFFPVSHICNVEIVIPSLWMAGITWHSSSPVVSVKFSN